MTDTTKIPDKLPNLTGKKRKHRKVKWFRANPWLQHVKQWKLANPEKVKGMKVTEITKEARKTYTPVNKKKKSENTVNTQQT